MPAPITESILQKISLVLPDICFSTYKASLFKAAYLLAYFGLLLVSEIVYTSLAQSNRQLLYSDVTPSTVFFQSDCPKPIKQDLLLSYLSHLLGTLCLLLAVNLNFRAPWSINLLVHRNGSPLSCSKFSGV